MKDRGTGFDEYRDLWRMKCFVKSAKQIRNYPMATGSHLSLEVTWPEPLPPLYGELFTVSVDRQRLPPDNWISLDSHLPNLGVGLGAAWCLAAWGGENNEVDINESFDELLLYLREQFQWDFHHEKWMVFNF